MRSRSLITDMSSDKPNGVSLVFLFNSKYAKTNGASPSRCVQQGMWVAVYPRIKASISSALTGTPRLISSQPVAVTMASSSMRMPMFQNASGTSGLGRTYKPGSMVSTMPGCKMRPGGDVLGVVVFAGGVWPGST